VVTEESRPAWWRRRWGVALRTLVGVVGGLAGLTLVGLALAVRDWQIGMQSTPDDGEIFTMVGFGLGFGILIPSVMIRPTRLGLGAIAVLAVAFYLVYGSTRAVTAG
jgi:hypothetical protein